MVSTHYLAFGDLSSFNVSASSTKMADHIKLDYEALLRDIDSHYKEGHPTVQNLEPIPSSHERQLNASHSYLQQPLHETHASRPQDSHTHGLCGEDDLDAHGD